jgi:hypothetical protein
MKKILALIILSFGLTFHSLAEENWTLIDETRLITRGDIVWGHQFGFMKDLSLCGYDIMLLSWSSDISNGELKKLEGKDAYVQIKMDGEVLDQELEFTLMFVGDFGSMEVGYFGAIVKSESFIEKLKQSSRVELSFSKPNNLIQILDIKSDSFNTKGLDQSYALLDNSCPVIM